MFEEIIVAVSICLRLEGSQFAFRGLQFINHRSCTLLRVPRGSRMSFSYQLDRVTVEKFVPSGSIGNYLLYDGTSRIRYVGRSDTDLQKRLLGHVDEPPYKYFKSSYVASPEEAFYKECEQYHECLASGFLLNKNHPDCPENMPHLCCPICSQ